MKPITPRPRSGTRHVILLFIPILLFVWVLVVAGTKPAPVVTSQLREHRIKQIYASLNLDGSYIPESTNIFGEKRPYSGVPSRAQASSVTFIRPDTVSSTVSDLTQRLKKAGFQYVEQAYPGSATVQYHFKDLRGEYIHIAVSSKPRDDDIENKFLMKQQLTGDDYALDMNAGPANVIIKVNLDSNSD